ATQLGPLGWRTSVHWKPFISGAGICALLLSASCRRESADLPDEKLARRPRGGRTDLADRRRRMEFECIDRARKDCVPKRNARSRAVESAGRYKCRACARSARTAEQR